MRARWGELPSRCGVTCRGEGSEPHRARYGCDGPAAVPWSVPCWACGKVINEACPWCQGKRRVPLDRCAGHLVDARTDRLLDLCLAFHDHGALPVAGGTIQQARTFTRALEVFQAEHAACEARAMDRARSQPPTTKDPRRG